MTRAAGSIKPESNRFKPASALLPEAAISARNEIQLSRVISELAKAAPVGRPFLPVLFLGLGAFWTLPLDWPPLVLNSSTPPRAVDWVNPAQGALAQQVRAEDS